MSDEQRTLSERITEYLGNGGLFNPELMDHDKVRDLLIECRDALDAYAGALPTPNQRTTQ